MLIIYAHPNREGHTGAILKSVTKELDKYVLVDLYKMKYDPVLHNEELYTMGYTKVSTATRKIQKLILEHEKIIFIYPTWWNSMPAILKGMCDKVFTAGFGFKYTLGIPRGLLSNKALLLTTTGGPVIYSRFIAKNCRGLARDVLKFMGVSSNCVIFGGSTKFSEEKIPGIETKVKNALKNF